MFLFATAGIGEGPPIDGDAIIRAIALVVITFLAGILITIIGLFLLGQLGKKVRRDDKNLLDIWKE